MKRTFAMVIVMILLVAALVGCTPADEVAPAQDSNDGDEAAEEFAPADHHLVLAIGMINHPVHRIVQLGFLKQAKEMGYEAEIVGPEEWLPTEMYAAAEAAAATGTTGVMLWAPDDSCFPVLKKLEAQGVAVGIAHFKFDPQPDGLTFNMACDPVAYGKEAAELIAQEIEGKTGTIAITQHSKNVTENAAAESFAATINAMNLEGVTVLEPELEGGDIAEATNINAAIIQKNTDLIAAFGTTGNSPVTWADAAQKAGKEPGEIAIIGMDYTEANLSRIETGEVLAIVAQPLYSEAQETVKMLDQYLRTGEVPYWTPLTAPLVYKGGQGVSDPATYTGILEEVKTWFE